eukprot:g10349.t1
MKLTFRSKAQREAKRQKSKDDKLMKAKERREKAKIKIRERLERLKQLASGKSQVKDGLSRSDTMADDVKQNESVDNSSKNPSTSHVEVVGKDSSSSKKKRKRYKLEWDDSEDTSSNDPYYDDIVDAKLMFGRGKFAGDVGREDMEETLHWSKKKLQDMVGRDWRALREEYEIYTRGKNASNPLRGWADIKIPQELMKGINIARYMQPTPIQRQCVPLGLDERDVMGIAATGSGKTAAFLIPLLNSILGQPDAVLDKCSEEGPLALILAPTRELVQQINSECKKLAQFTNIRALSVVGGQSIDQQATSIRNGVHLISATPGRLVDLIENSYLVLQQCYYLVLDEADRMIDMGFEPAVIQILDSMVAPGKKTTHMFSATMPPQIERLAKKYLDNPVKVRIGDKSQMNTHIRQDLVIVSNQVAKTKQLSKILKRTSGPIIVFVNTKSNSENIYNHVLRFGYRAVLLHGGKEQVQREKALYDFKNGHADVLVATDVAGRGIDVPNVKHVINVDMPSEIERYTHRIGRTGRAGKDGMATTLLVKGVDGKYIAALKNSFKKTNNKWKKEWDQEFDIVEQRNVE